MEGMGPALLLQDSAAAAGGTTGLGKGAADEPEGRRVSRGLLVSAAFRGNPLKDGGRCKGGLLDVRTIAGTAAAISS